MKFYNIALMVLPRMAIVLCGLAEDIEYKVKRKIRGKPIGSTTSNTILLINAILPETITWMTRCSKYKFYPYRPPHRKSKRTLVDMKSIISFLERSGIIAIAVRHVGIKTKRELFHPFTHASSLI